LFVISSLFVKKLSVIRPITELQKSEYFHHGKHPVVNDFVSISANKMPEWKCDEGEGENEK
jgi:hypothetical protein